MSNFGAFSNLSKLVLTADMLLGRLEIFPILALFSRPPGACAAPCAPRTEAGFKQNRARQAVCLPGLLHAAARGPLPGPPRRQAPGRSIFNRNMAATARAHGSAVSASITMPLWFS